MAHGFDGLGFPTGWFHVGWSAEFEPGRVQPMRYFGRDLVAFRAGSGQLVIADAHCPHRGAHLGYGGQVAGTELVCPFHGWQWAPDGRRVEQPGQPPCSDRRLPMWPVLEQDGLILLWHDPSGCGPDWRPPVLSESSDPAYYPAFPFGAHCEEVRIPPQLPLENVADLAHVRFVHRWPDMPVVDLFEPEGRCFHGEFHGTMTTPRGPATVTIENRAWGVGLLYSWFSGLHDSTQVVATTPIDRERSHMRMTVWVRRPPGGGGDEPRGLARALIDAQFQEAFGPAADRPILENQTYVERSPFVPEEGRLFRALRRWSSQFYAEPASSASSSSSAQR